MEDTTRSMARGARHSVRLMLDSMSVEVIEGPDRGRAVRDRPDVIRIGSSADNDLVLTDTTVSRRHAILRIKPEGLEVEDLGSKNGTWLSGNRVRLGYVTTGGRVSVGSTVLTVTTGSRQIVAFTGDSASYCGMLGQSTAMKELFALVQQVARFDVPVTITGETGTGKDLLARALHQSGARADRPFQVLDCGSIVRDLLPSELFGHEKGAYTGADQPRPGIFEAAAGGTVFLDEVGEIDPSVQPNLLRVLETRQVQRLGSRQSVPADFRLVSATNRDLKQMVEAGRFRADLYYRLATVTMRIPPLRERAEDISLLARAFLEACAKRHNSPTSELTPDAEHALQAHPWPGNVRELRNLMESLVVRLDGAPVLARDIETALSAPGAGTTAATGATPAAAQDLKGGLDEAERQLILDALNAAQWNRSLAARRLGIARSTLYEKIQQYGLVRP